MYSPAATATTTPTPTSTTPATSDQSSEYNAAPGQLPKPGMTRDFHVDTFFNPVWTSGPNVIPFAQDGTVTRPGAYATELYPGYHADRNRAQHPQSVNTSYSQGFARKEAKPWKNVAITEQDDAEWAAIQARGKIGSGIWQPARGFGSAPAPVATHSAKEPEQVYYPWQPKHNTPAPRPDQAPELVYTWPPKPGAC